MPLLKLKGLSTDMANCRVYNLYIFSFLLLFLQSMHVWFLWGNMFKIACPIFFLIVAYNNKKVNPQCYQRYSHNSKLLFLFVIILIFLRGSLDAGTLSICKSVVSILVLFEIVTVSDKMGMQILLCLTKFFGIISFISLVGWILFLAGVSLPNQYIIDEEFGYSFDNYYIFLYNRLGLIPRFCSVFLEPGYYGQLASIILFANRMKLNNVYLISIFVSALFSLSLAGYVLIVMGFIFVNLNRNNIKKLFLLVVVGYSVFYVIKDFNGGDNIINDYIFARLEIEDGKLAGDDRSTDRLDNYFRTKIYQNNEYLFGVGSSFSKMDWGHGVAGYKAYIVENGYVGLLLAIFGYLLILYRYKKTDIYMKLCFVLFMTSRWRN